jgi:hypothetical protein
MTMQTMMMLYPLPLQLHMMTMTAILDVAVAAVAKEVKVGALGRKRIASVVVCCDLCCCYCASWPHATR